MGKTTVYQEQTKESVVTWDSENDPKKPANWSITRHYTIIVLTTLVWFMVSFGSSVYAAAIPPIALEFNISRKTSVLGVTTYVAGFSFGPLIWGPASELYGRTRPLWIGLLFACFFQIPFALARNTETLLVARFFGGFFGSASLAIVNGIYADFVSPVGRGIASGFYSAGAFSGPVFGSSVGNLLTAHASWRWTGWITLIGIATFGFLCFLVTPESAENVLLRRKARILRKETGNPSLYAASEVEPARLSVFIHKYLTKPVRMFFTEPIVSLPGTVAWLLLIKPQLIVFTLYMSFVYGILYLTLGSLSNRFFD